MYIDDAKHWISVVNNMSMDELVKARAALYDHLNHIVDMAEHEFSVVGVELALDLCSGNVLRNQIYLINLFQLHYLLNIKLIATIAPMNHDMYVIHASYHEHEFVQPVSPSVYEQIYKNISTFVTEHEVFSPYNH